MTSSPTIAENFETGSNEYALSGDWKEVTVDVGAHPIETVETIRKRGLDFDSAERALRSYATSVGEDLEDLLRGAARHFDRSTNLEPHKSTAEELDLIVDDEQKAEFD